MREWSRFFSHPPTARKIGFDPAVWGRHLRVDGTACGMVQWFEQFHKTIRQPKAACSSPREGSQHAEGKNKKADMGRRAWGDIC